VKFPVRFAGALCLARRLAVVAVAVAGLASTLTFGPRPGLAAESPKPPALIAAAIDNSARPAADHKADALRKPAELLAFAGVKRGEKVLELIPGTGYFTRLFSLAVGPSGHVTELVTAEEVKASAKAAEPIKAIAAEPTFANVTVTVQPISKFKLPEQVDMVWTSQNYHDLHDTAFGPADIPAFNKAVFAALKPGGVFMVVDHADAAGRGVQDTQTLHRIDPAAAKREIEAAGFTLEAQSDVLANPADDHKLRIFDPKIRGKTDKFVFKFRKPS
jgi:predicted methyltransferase